MKKILIVISCNLHWAPYYYRYEKVLKEHDNSFDVILWNREGIDDTVQGKKIEYSVPDSVNDGSATKIFKFLGFSRFVKRQIKNTKYDRIIFTGTYAGMPAFISSFLMKHYEKKYWIDLRDITYERFCFFYKMEDRAIKYSYKTVISSRGYLPYLPKHEYGYVHNIDPSMDLISDRYKKTLSKKIRISYIGNLGYWDSCKELIDVFANDSRFQLNFVGPNYEIVENYCINNNVLNVSFHGRFPREDTVNYYNDTDIIYNVYGNDTLNVRTALSNKVYYCIKFHIPILVSPGTYMEEVVKKYNIGFIFDRNSDFANQLFIQYASFCHDPHLFNEAWEDIKKEDELFNNQLQLFLN